MSTHRARSARTSKWILGTVATLAALALPATQAHAAYPSPAPDFAHPGATPHFSSWNPAGGDADRPILTFYVEWNDVKFPTNLSSAQLAQRFFGPMPSQADYFRVQSDGKLILTPAAESEGTANDGIVRLSLSQSQADFFAMSEPDQNKALLEAADGSVNYASFDSNGNGTIETNELVLNRIESAPTLAAGAGCGATRGISSVTLDGKTFNLGLAQDNTATNFITVAHELWHQMFGTRDFYGFGVGSWDISGPSCDGGGSGIDGLRFSMAAWEKLHLGWIAPTVVTKDGYYDVREAGDQTNDAFILYDHDRGTDDYFIVENRRPRAGTYDQNVPGSGLIAWRMDEKQYNSATDTVRPVEIMRPDNTTAPGCSGGTCSGGASDDAWDGGRGATPQRTMTRAWQDGTGSKVAMRAVPCASENMRTYFDVRGPGVMVDTFRLDNCRTAVADLPHLTPGQANTVSFDAMNTGEASDSFAFTFEGLPAGWSASTDTRTIAAGAGTTPTVQLTPPAGASAADTFTVRAVGRSTTDGSVTSSAPLRVKVFPHVSIGDASLTEGDNGTQQLDFTVTASVAPDRPVTVAWATANGSATAPSDYEAASGTVTIPAGATSRTISVTVKGDTTPEPDETFLVNLSGPENAVIGDGQGVGTIKTDPEPSVSIDDATITEEDAPLAFTVKLSEANNTPVDVDWKTEDGTAKAPADYTAANGTVHFDVGETTKTVTVPIREDFADELEETFAVKLSNVVNAEPGDMEARGTIIDDDRDGAFTCRAAGANLLVSEYGVSNGPENPCQDDAKLLQRVNLGLIDIQTLKSSTAQVPKDLTGTSPQIGDRAVSHAEAANVRIRVGLLTITVSTLTSDARAECRGGALPALSGSSRVTLLEFGGRPVMTVDGRLDLPLGLATLRLNQTVTTRNGVVQRALVVDNALGSDVIIGEAKAGFVGTDVHPNGSPCTA